MSQEKFAKYYNEIINNVLTEQVLQNVSLKAREKVNGEIFEELKQAYTELLEENNSLKEETNSIKEESQSSISRQQENSKNEIQNLNNQINSLRGQVSTFNSMKNEYEKLKSSANNSDVFRNELVKEREAHQNTKAGMQAEIDELKNQIDTLQAPKRKKSSKVKMDDSGELAINNQSEPESPTKDGGSF